MKLLIGTFGTYLNQKENSSQKILSQIFLPDQRIAKVILPVNYSKKHFLKPLKKFKPKIFILIGNWDGSFIKLESKANNKYVTLKSPIKRFIINIWVEMLWFFKKNIIIKELPSEKFLTYLPIDTLGPKKISISTIKSVKYKSVDTGYFIYNYAMYIIQRYINKYKLKTRFYFINIPKKPTNSQEKEIVGLIRNIIYKK